LDAKYVLNKNNYLIVESSYDNDKYSHRYTAPTVEEYITPEGVILHPVFYDGDVSLQSCQQRVLLHAKGVFNWGKLQRLSVGSEYQLDILESPYRITSDKESATMISLYAQDELNFTENFNVTAGLRLVHHNEFGTKPTSKISVFYKPNDFSFLASYSNGFKTPTLKELYYRYERTMMSKLRLYLGNPDLKPQTSNYFSTGIQYNNNKWSASISPYYNRVDDMIQLVEVPTSYEDKVRDVDKTMQYKNIEDAKIKGIDVVFEIHLNKNWLAGGGYSYVDAHANMLNEDGIMEHVIIDGTSFHRANLRIVWNHDWAKYKLGIGIFGNAESKSYYRYYGNADGYVTCRLNTTHHLKTKKSWKVELNAGIDNLFDYHETKPYGYNYASTTPGRTFYITFILKYEKNNNIN
jgi:outer membrane receptor for ferrienterochelin and colicins